MTKTDFKNIYEAFMHCDTNKLKKEFAAMYSDNEEQATANSFFSLFVCGARI